MNIIKIPYSFEVGQEIAVQIKGVTNDRVYQCAARIIEIHGHIAKAEYRQPWSRPHDRIRVDHFDLRHCKLIKRRKVKT